MESLIMETFNVGETNLLPFKLKNISTPENSTNFGTPS